MHYQWCLVLWVEIHFPRENVYVHWRRKYDREHQQNCGIAIFTAQPHLPTQILSGKTMMHTPQLNLVRLRWELIAPSIAQEYEECMEQCRKSRSPLLTWSTHNFRIADWEIILWNQGTGPESIRMLLSVMKLSIADPSPLSPRLQLRPQTLTPRPTWIPQS